MADTKQILIVEDTEENRVFLAQILEDNGYGYEVARNGAEAIAALKETRPDAVLLDIMMPRKTGISVYQEMKKDPNLRTVPIIVVTGVSSVTGVDLRTGESQPTKTYADDTGRDLGGFLHEKFKDIEPDGFIEKPIDPLALVKKLTELLH